MRSLLVVAVLCCLGADAQDLFDQSVLHEVRIRSTMPALWDTLAQDQQGFLAGAPAHYRAVDVIVDGQYLPASGIRFKGNYSYWGFPGKKRPMRLDFDRFIPDQVYAGRTKVNLHNFAGDPSFLRESLAYMLLREQGLPAARTAYAQVYLNDTLLGVYLLVEELDKRFCRDHFGHTGTMYQCIDDTEMAWQGDDPVAYADEFKIDHDANNVGWAPLLELMRTVHEDRSAVFRQHLDALFDVDGYLRTMVMDVLLNNWDSFHDNGRNFSLYHHPADQRLHWIPWDYNLCLWQRDLELPPRDDSADGYKPLVARIVNDPLLQEDLWKTACAILPTVDTRHVHDKLTAMRTLIAQAVEADPNKFYSTADFQANLYRSVTVSMLRSGVQKDVILPGVYDRLVKRLSTLKLQAQRQTDCVAPPLSELLMNVYPNPSSGPVTVRWDLRHETVDAQLTIHDALGRPVLQRSYSANKAVNEERLHLAPGHYTLRLVAGTRHTITRIVIS